MQTFHFIAYNAGFFWCIPHTAYSNFVAVIFIGLEDFAQATFIAGIALDEVSDGRVFTGRQAVDLGLIDAIGDEDTARDWLAANRDLPADLDAVDYEWNDSPLPWPVALLEESLAGFMPSRPVVSAGPRLYAIIQ